jgi:hypothetical protein
LREGLGLVLAKPQRQPVASRRKIRTLAARMPVPPQAALLAAELAVRAHTVGKAEIASRTKMNIAQNGPRLSRQTFEIALLHPVA